MTPPRLDWASVVAPLASPAAPAAKRNVNATALRIRRRIRAVVRKHSPRHAALDAHRIRLYDALVRSHVRRTGDVRREKRWPCPPRLRVLMTRRIVGLGLLVAVTAAVAAQAQTTPAGSVRTAGVSVVLPTGWHSLKQSAAPSRTDPVTRLVVSSTPVRFGRGCNDIDYLFSRSGVALVLVEWVRPTPGARFALRPDRFTGVSLPVIPPPALECFRGRGGSAQFRDHGRRFAAFILVGNEATPALVAKARGVLDTLAVTKRP